MKNIFLGASAVKSLLLALIIIGGLMVQSCKDKDQPANNTPYTVSGAGTGSQVVPAVSTSGAATLTGSYNPNTRVFTYTSNWNGLTGAPTGGGFYYGASGSNGTAVGSPWTFANVTATGSTSGTMTLTSEQAIQFLAGNWYYLYTTPTNVSGEVRGQITAAR